MWTNQAGWIPPPPAGRAASGWAGPGGAEEPIKAAPGRGQIPTPMAMAALASRCRWPWPCSHSPPASWCCPRDARPGLRGPQGRRTAGAVAQRPQVQKAAQAAVANYNMGSNSDYYYRDITILRAQSQVRAAGRGREGAAPTARGGDRRPQPGPRWRGD